MAKYNPSGSKPAKSSKKGAGPHFPTTAGGTSVSVSEGKGGVNIGTPTGCPATKQHSNVSYHR